MLSVFDHEDYRKYLSAWIESLGRHRHGSKGRMAKAIGVSSSLVSQILKGEKTLTPDQTSDLCEFLGLTGLETDYLHLLVDLDRAGSVRYQQKLKGKIFALQQQSRQIGKRVPRHKELNDQQRAIYYSSWLYTGVRNLTAIPQLQQAEALAKHLHLPVAVITRVLHFLLENGLCVESDGKVTYGPASTHIDRDSPFVNKHHQNWRLRAIEKMEEKNDNDIFFTSPMSLSMGAADEIRVMLPTVIQSIMKIIGPSPSETTACLNIDWFNY